MPFDDPQDGISPLDVISKKKEGEKNERFMEIDLCGNHGGIHLDDAGVGGFERLRIVGARRKARWERRDGCVGCCADAPKRGNIGV